MKLNVRKFRTDKQNSASSNKLWYHLDEFKRNYVFIKLTNMNYYFY